MPMDIGTDFENDYRNALKTKSTQGFDPAHKVNELKESGGTNPVLQTGNTGPADSSRPDSVEDYLEYLNMTYPDSIFTIGEYDYNAFTSGSSLGLGNIVLSSELVEQMIDDPEFAKEMEKSIGEISHFDKMLVNQFRANDRELLANGTFVNADGSKKSWELAIDGARMIEEAESTNTFLQMEELREKAMHLNTEKNEYQQIEHDRAEQTDALAREIERRVEAKRHSEEIAENDAEDSGAELHFTPFV